MPSRRSYCLLLLATALLAGLAAPCWADTAPLTTTPGPPWWIWPLALFGVCFVLGVVAVPAGVGGGVLFVPIVSSLFPFHLDFVRGGGLLVALASSMTASPILLRHGLAHLGLALPISLIVASSQIVGAMLGLALPPSLVQTLLGLCILIIVAITAIAGNREFPTVNKPDPLSAALHLHGIYCDPRTGQSVSWAVHRSPQAFLIFLLVGLLAGMFGLGAGWANVPILNLVMGAPLKIAAGTSSLVLSLTSSAAWVYINQGAVLPLIVVPSMLGMMLGARIGVKLLQHLPPRTVRRLVMVVLALAGARALLKGLSLWI